MSVKNEIKKTFIKIFSFVYNRKYANLLKHLWAQSEYKNPYDFEKGLDIAFIVPEVMGSSGGHRNIFRAVKKLNDYGHKLTVYIQNPKLLEEQKYIINKNFNDMRYVDILPFKNNEIKHHDVCIATWWETFYMMYEHKEKFKQMFYMVQDFESWFYPMGSEYILAENSYKYGVPVITSGPWPAKFLNEKYGTETHPFLFPLDTSIYNCSKNRTKKNKNVIFFAKPEMPRRCYELGLKALKIVKEKRPDIEIIFFGSNKLKKNKLHFDVTFKGILPTIRDLADLYRNADLGICFSTTNPSLVPYEMMACGLAVADIDVNEAEYKYGGRDSALLLNPLPEVMAEEIIQILDNDELRKKYAQNGIKYASENFISEDEMGKVFESIILSKITKENFDTNKK